MAPANARKFPLRMPHENIVKAHPSLEAAFAAGDYIYVARFGQDDPELRGCALIMLPNRTGGERVLDRHDVRTARSFLFRAYGAWRDGRMDEARRWLAEGRATGEMLPSLDRLQTLMDRDVFRIVLHADHAARNFLGDYRFPPGFDVLLTWHALGDGLGRLQFNRPLSDVVPPGAPIDLVVADTSSTFPVGVSKLGAPVVLAPWDHEWQYDFLGQIFPEVDVACVASSTEIVELGQRFGVKCNVYFDWFPNAPVPVSNLSKAFEDAHARPMDLVFSGGIVDDFYQNKRQLTLSLYNISSEFNVLINSWFPVIQDYFDLLQKSKVALMACRFSNNWMARVVENLSHGVMNMVLPEHGAPYAFSQPYDCFLEIREETAIADIERHLREYPARLQRFRKQADMMEDELRDLAPTGTERGARYYRHLLFVTNVLLAGQQRACERPVARKTVIPHLDHLLYLKRRQSPEAFEEHLGTLIQGAQPEGKGRASEWLRLALMQATATPSRLDDAIRSIDTGLTHHQTSLPLTYARALCARKQGDSALAKELFDRVRHGDLRIEPDEPYPAMLDKSHLTYWVRESRIREQHQGDVLEHFVPEKRIWQSMATSNRAAMGFDAGHFAEATALATEALGLFDRNEVAQRTLLRALYARFDAGDTTAGDRFLRDYAQFREIDGMIFHDLAALAMDIHRRCGHDAQVKELASDVERLLERLHMPAKFFKLHPEVEPLLGRYGLPHGALIGRVDPE